MKKEYRPAPNFYVCSNGHKNFELPKGEEKNCVVCKDPLIIIQSRRKKGL